MAKVTTTAIAAGTPLPADGLENTAASPTPVAPEVKSAAAGVLAAGALPTAAADPNRPGLETPVPVLPPNPFVKLNEWQNGTTHGILRALEVPGGCLVKSSYAFPGHMGEALCFVPGVTIVDGKLVAWPAKQ